MERGYKLKDRPEYKSKPQPITFKKTDTVAKAVKTTEKACCKDSLVKQP